MNSRSSRCHNSSRFPISFVVSYLIRINQDQYRFEILSCLSDGNLVFNLAGKIGKCYSSFRLNVKLLQNDKISDDIRALGK